MNIYTADQSVRMRAIFAQGGPRAEFINNYFRINEPNIGNGFCNGDQLNIVSTNLACLSIIWSITGPATIVNGQGTNQITIQGTGVGNATLTATAGEYTDSKTIIVGPQSPTFIPYGILCESVPFTLCANPITNSLSHQWIARVGNSNVVLQETSSWCVEVPSNTLYVDLFVTNKCGTAKKRQFIRLTNCRKAASISIAPNPSSSTINITALQGSSFTEIRIIDKFGYLRKQFKYQKETKSATLNVSELKMDIYQIQTFDGKKWATITFSKQ